MCLATPLKIKSIDTVNKIAQLENGREVKLHLVPEAKVGDYVLAQANIATQVLDKRDVVSIKKVIEEITA